MNTGNDIILFFSGNLTYITSVPETDLSGKLVSN